jgi:DNA invertase Pin-like site-specific DNA recombinase
MTTGVLVGYARTSTAEQRAGLDAQLRDLKAAGCRKVFSEQVIQMSALPTTIQVYKAIPMP